MARTLPARLLPVLLSAAVGVLALGARARAQTSQPPLERSVEVQILQSAIGPRGFLTVDSATVPAHKLFGLTLLGGYQAKPFTIETTRTNTAETQTIDVVKTQVWSELTGAIGLFDRMQLGFALPITYVLEGQGFAPDGQASGKLSGGGLGDLRVEAKGVISSWRPAEDSSNYVNLAGILGFTAPTGDQDKFLGDKGWTVRAKAVAEVRAGALRAGGLLGAIIRTEKTRTFAAEIQHQLLYGAAVEYFVHRQVSLLAELWGRNGFSSYADASPMEADGALRFALTSMVSLQVGGGVGLIKGIGSPQARVFAGLSWAPDFRDGDGDGVADLDDRCPDQPEDRDGFRDGDGCPEIDNDGDGLLDAQDRCATDAEDLDQFQDEDGCPEADNDNDGIADLNDPCPNAAEDGKGKRPKDGCPSSAEDSDGDGVVDARDKCSDEPEDRDGFQDYDGCPDPDNDDDGIPDNFDECPGAAEDPDGFEDADGCPEPDNDKDGFSDATDKCPDKAETLNGNKDEDGCPDPGAELVRLAQGGDGAKIELRERIGFASKPGTPQLSPTGATVVNLVALLLKGHPELAVVRIDVTSDGASQSDTQARADAIKAALVARGVADERLKASGRGAGASKVDFVVESVIDPKKAAAGAAGTAPPAPASE